MDSEIAELIDKKKGVTAVNSNDLNERKLARRQRIQARLEASEKAQAIAEGTYSEPKQEQSLLHETIETSEDTLRQLYLEGKELISNIIVASDAKEVFRRETELKEKNDRLEKLKEESALALQKLDEISCKWETILNINGPLELFQHMKEQKAKCLDLIEQKNNLIKNFQMELKLADEKFMKGRKAMYEELALLTRRIDEQVLLMRKAYRIELNRIEESVDITRAEITNKHQETWLSLYNKRENEETTNMSRKFELVESFHEELHKLHVDHEEKYRATRIQLETDIQILEQELEQVKALCLLNSEKLDYNYQVLKKREEENVYIKNHQKRRLNKLQDMVNTLKRKIEEKGISTEEEYKKLTRDVKRYYANVLETEKKAELFSETNDEKFNNIWKMKDEEAKDLLDKIFSADMIIHEQILGVDWTPPSNTNFKIEDLPSYRTAIAVVQDFNKRKKGVKPKILPDAARDLREYETSPEVLEGHKRLLCHILELVADQSGFLMEEKLDELLQPYSEEEKTFVRLDNVFVAIGIQKEKDIEILKRMFLPYSICLLCERRSDSVFSVNIQTDASDVEKRKDSSRQQSILHIRELEEKVSKLRIQARAGSVEYADGTEKQDSNKIESQDKWKGSEFRRESRGDYLQDSHEFAKDGSMAPYGQSGLNSRESRGTGSAGRKPKIKCNITHPLIIEKFNVLKALKDFVTFYHADRLKVTLGIEEKLDPKRFTISRLLSEEDIFLYWDKYREAIPAKLENIWNGVFKALERYLVVLQERHKLNRKAKALIRQNQELKRLVSHYKASDSCVQFKLPEISSVPNEPINPVEIATIVNKLSF